MGALVALGLRVLALGPGALTPAQAMEVSPLLNPLAAEPLGARLATAPVLLARYALLCAFPARLVAD